MFDGTTNDILVNDRIRDAIATIEELGWCQYERRDEDGRVCVIGAFVGYGRAADLVTREALRRVARAAGCDRDMNLWQFNDGLLPLTGKYAVIDAMRRAMEIHPCAP